MIAICTTSSYGDFMEASDVTIIAERLIPTSSVQCALCSVQYVNVPCTRKSLSLELMRDKVAQYTMYEYHAKLCMLEMHTFCDIEKTPCLHVAMTQLNSNTLLGAILVFIPFTIKSGSMHVKVVPSDYC